MKHFYHCRKFCWVGSTTLEYFCITFTQISSFLLENIEHSHNLMGYNVPCKILKIHFYVFYILPHKQILLCSFLIFYKVFHHQFSIKFLVSSVLTWYLHICQNHLSHIVFFLRSDSTVPWKQDLPKHCFARTLHEEFWWNQLLLTGVSTCSAYSQLLSSSWSGRRR